MALGRSLFFHPFRFDPVNQQLWRGTQLLPLRPKTFAVLRYLIEHAGVLVSKEDLLKAVWPDTHGAGDLPKRSVHELRKILGDEAATPQFIETMTRRGWRFVAEVVSSQHSVVSSPPPPTQSSVLSPQHSVLVGRETELTQLHQWLAKALRGERQTVFVTGEPGIGKTAVVDAFLQGLESRVQRLTSEQVQSPRSKVQGQEENQKAKTKNQKSKISETQSSVLVFAKPQTPNPKSWSVDRAGAVCRAPRCRRSLSAGAGGTRTTVSHGGGRTTRAASPPAGADVAGTDACSD